jgi:diketogulonate reductase-like aldo/keto reductase
VTAGQLGSNIAAFDLVLTEEDWDRLAGLGEEPGAYWERRAALPWH